MDEAGPRIKVPVPPGQLRIFRFICGGPPVLPDRVEPDIARSSLTVGLYTAIHTPPLNGVEPTNAVIVYVVVDMVPVPEQPPKKVMLSKAIHSSRKNLVIGVISYKINKLFQSC